jgi:hypothetical protein
MMEILDTAGGSHLKIYLFVVAKKTVLFGSKYMDHEADSGAARKFFSFAKSKCYHLAHRSKFKSDHALLHSLFL